MSRSIALEATCHVHVQQKGLWNPHAGTQTLTSLLHQVAQWLLHIRMVEEKKERNSVSHCFQFGIFIQPVTIHTLKKAISFHGSGINKSFPCRTGLKRDLFLQLHNRQYCTLHFPHSKLTQFSFTSCGDSWERKDYFCRLFLTSPSGPSCHNICLFWVDPLVKCSNVSFIVIILKNWSIWIISACLTSCSP